MSEDPNDLMEQRTLALRNDAMNYPVTGFNKWITASSGKLSKFSSMDDAEVRAAASDLQSRLESQARALRNLTRKIWYRQREQAAAEFEVARLRKPVRSVEFDCSASLSHIPGYATQLRPLGRPVCAEERNHQDS